jgi:hypothetical protein
MIHSARGSHVGQGGLHWAILTLATSSVHAALKSAMLVGNCGHVVIVSIVKNVPTHLSLDLSLACCRPMTYLAALFTFAIQCLLVARLSLT